MDRLNEQVDEFHRDYQDAVGAVCQRVAMALEQLQLAVGEEMAEVLAPELIGDLVRIGEDHASALASQRFEQRLRLQALQNQDAEQPW